MFPCHQAMWLIRPGVILRKKMQDFTVGHAFLLEALESPFMLGGMVHFNDLVVAALICSMPFSKAREYLMRPLFKMQRDVQRWALWCRFCRLDADEEMAAFKNYISAYVDSPEPWKKQGKASKESAIPLSIRMAWVLMERMTEDEAWNCPMSRALGYYTAYAEYNGQEFMTERDAIRLKVI